MNDITTQNTDIQSVVSAEVDMQIKTAKTYPRDLKHFFETAKARVSYSLEIAESCMYCLPRAGKEIKGPSIRLAEIAASAYGNLHCATRTIAQDGRTVTAQAVAWDLENNVKITTEVKKSVIDKYGKPYKTDMVDMTAAACASRALRNAIFKVIPRSFIDEIYEQAIKVAVGNTKSLNERRTRVFMLFSKIGITQDKVLQYLGRKDELEITLKDIEKMQGIREAIREGHAIEEYFPEEKTVTKTKENATELEKKADEIVDDL